MVWCCANAVGGESVADNCQILQTRVNRIKSDKDEIDKTKLKDYSCDISFTGKLCFAYFVLFLIYE